MNPFFLKQDILYMKDGLEAGKAPSFLLLLHKPTVILSFQSGNDARACVVGLVQMCPDTLSHRVKDT